jgi:methyl-accepting chemotaxis protein
MRTLTQQSAAMVTDQARTLSGVGGAAQDVLTAVSRTVAGLAEQARGASEVAKAMDDTRKQAILTARAVAEQANAGRQILTTARQVAKLAAAVMGATVEQSKATAGLAREGEDVRRIARQTARAVSEQAQAVISLSTNANRQSGTANGVVDAAVEQGTLAELVLKALGEAREIVRVAAGAITLVTRAESGRTREGADLRAHLGGLRTRLLALETRPSEAVGERS